MKKNLLTLFGALGVVSIVYIACGGIFSIATPIPILTVTPVPTATPHPTVVPKTYQDLGVGFVQIGSESWWRTANIASFRETAIALGITLKFYDSTNDLRQQQSRAFQQFIEDPEVNVIVIVPFAATGWEELLQQAKDAGKIVFLLDRSIDAPEDLYFTRVGPDFVEEGRKAATAMCKLLEGSAEKNIFEIQGTPGSGAQIDRGQGFREKMSDCGITITQSQTGNFYTAEGKAAMEVLLAQSRNIQGVFAQNDEMAIGAIEALKKVGLKPGLDIKIVSIDGERAAFEAMIAGELNVIVECNPLYAPQVYKAALAALNGETLPKFIASQDSVFFMDDPNLQEITTGRKY